MVVGCGGIQGLYPWHWLGLATFLRMTHLWKAKCHHFELCPLCFSILFELLHYIGSGFFL